MLPSFSQTSAPQLTTLAELLAHTAGTEQGCPGRASAQYPLLTLPERIKLAVDLASSFFYIYDTPWYVHGWSKEKVKMALDNKDVARPGSIALIERRFPDKGKSQSPSTQNAQDAFTRLCICLEKLCFDKPLESLPAYQKYCRDG